MKNPFSFLSRLSDGLNEFMEDMRRLAPYRINLLSDAYGNGAHNRNDLRRREMLIYSWLMRDRSIYGKKHPYCAHYWISLGDLYFNEKRPIEARPFYQYGLEILEEADEDWIAPRLLDAKRKLASCYMRSYRYAEAEPLLIDVCEALVPDGEIELDEKLSVLESLKRCLEEQGKAVLAVQTARSIIRLKEADGLPESRAIASDYSALSKLLAEVGETTESEVFSELAEAIEWYEITAKACGEDAFTLLAEVEKLRKLYRRRQVDHICRILDKKARVIELTRKVKGVEYPRIESDLIELAELLEERGKGGDGTVAHRYRMRAKNIATNRKEAEAARMSA